MNLNSFPHPHIGIDIGRVIMSAVDENGRSDTSFLSESEEGAMATPPHVDAFAVVGELCARTNGKVWLVSKAGPRIAALTERWLAHWKFSAATGVPPNQVIFCRERKDKATHAKRHRLTHFIDDRIDVLEHLSGVVPHRLLFGYQKPGTVIRTAHAKTWSEVRQLLLGDPGTVM